MDLNGPKAMKLLREEHSKRLDMGWQSQNCDGATWLKSSPFQESDFWASRWLLPDNTRREIRIDASGEPIEVEIP